MIRDIHIRAVLNGFVVKVGCQEVVFNSIDVMLVALKDYLNDPKKVEGDYMQNSINAKKLGRVEIVADISVDASSVERLSENLARASGFVAQDNRR